MRPQFWSAAIWATIFCHSLFTRMDAAVWLRVLPLGILLGLILILTGVTYRKSSEMPELMLFNAWVFLVAIGFILRTTSVVDDVILGVGIGVLTMLAGVMWCIVSSLYSLSEGGWHWYVWSMTIVLSLCAASIGAPRDDTLLTLYGITAGIVVVANILYWWHILRQDAHNAERTQLLWRTCAGALGTLTFLILAILHGESVIGKTTWQDSIAGVEIYTLVVIVVDAFVPGLTQTSISRPYTDTIPVYDV